MYPLKKESLVITQAEKKVEAIRDGLRGAVLALEVERASIADINQDFDADLQAILGLGVLLNDLQVRRMHALELSRKLPSPNKVPVELRDRLVNVTKVIFETIDHVKNIQAETYRLARLNLRAASHKVNFASKVQSIAAKERSTAAA